jgi:hypothetical protein
MLTPQQAKQIAIDAAKNVAEQYNADNSAKNPLYELSLMESMKKVGIPFSIYGKPEAIISIGSHSIGYTNVVQRYSPSMKELPKLELTGVLAKRLAWCPREMQKTVKGMLILVQYLPDTNTVRIVKEVPFCGISRPLYNQANSPITMKYDFEAPAVPTELEWIGWKRGNIPSWLERRTVSATPPSINDSGSLAVGTKGIIEIRAMFYTPVITEFSGTGVWLVRQKCNKNGKQLRNQKIVLK